MFNLIPWRGKEATTPMRATSPLTQLRDEFETLLDRFFTRSPFGEDWGQRGWGLDLEDGDGELVVRADAPGFEADDFDIQVQGNNLTIRAERRQESGKREDDSYACSQRRLHRSVSLPSGIDPDKIKATYRNGILELHLPKSPHAMGKRIEVKKT